MFFHEIFLRRVPGKLVLFDMLLPNPTNQIMADHQLTWAKAVICFVVFEDFRLVKCDDLTRHTVDGKDATQPVHVKNLPFVIGFVYIEWCIGFLRFLPSTVCGCFSLARRPKWGKGMFPEISWVWSGNQAGTLGSTALPPIPLVVCILAIGFATESDDATGLKLTWESVVI